MPIAEIYGGFSAFKALMDSAKTLKDITTTPAGNAAVIELQEKILAAQMAQAALIDRIRELEAEVRSFETWEAEKQRYDLKDLGWGALAYMLKPGMRDGKPPHWICVNCFGHKHISIVQYAMVPSQGLRYVCQTCKAQINPSQNAITGNNAKWFD